MKLGQYARQEWKITEVDFGRKETNLEVDKLSYSKENAVGLQYLIED